jgi:hypothetical protein
MLYNSRASLGNLTGMGTVSPWAHNKRGPPLRRTDAVQISATLWPTGGCGFQDTFAATGSLKSLFQSLGSLVEVQVFLLWHAMPAPALLGLLSLVQQRTGRS